MHAARRGTSLTRLKTLAPAHTYVPSRLLSPFLPQDGAGSSSSGGTQALAFSRALDAVADDEGEEGEGEEEPKEKKPRAKGTAWTEDETIMAVRHRRYPKIQGVQFHPESIITENGLTIVRNWVALINA